MSYFKIKFFLVVLVIVCGIKTSLGQELKEEIHNLDNSSLQNSLLQQVLLLPIDGNHTLKKINTNWQNIYSSNTIIVQEGIHNQSCIEQTGSVQEIHLLQVNSFNEANLRSVGDNIKISAIQTGDGNQINTYIENYGPETRSAELTQQGNYNKIELSLKGDRYTDPSFEQRMVINQVGNSHEFNAAMEPFSAPLEVTQTAGAGGEGMKINVTSSAFSFPMK